MLLDGLSGAGRNPCIGPNNLAGQVDQTKQPISAHLESNEASMYRIVRREMKASQDKHCRNYIITEKRKLMQSNDQTVKNTKV